MKKLGRNDACWCGSGKKYKACHMAMDEKIESIELQGHIVPRHLATRDSRRASALPSMRWCATVFQTRTGC